MLKRNLQIFILSIFGVVLGLSILAMPQLASAQAVTKTPVPEKPDTSQNQMGHAAIAAATTDNYGYQLSTKTSAWMDATSGTPVEFPDNDDEFSDPLPIGFTFPFYEGSYTHLYASTNGLISFGEGSDAYENRDIPRDTFPNNYIAPFWDDLKLKVDGSTIITQVYYKSGTDAQGKYFVLEWNKITRFNAEDDTLTFEVILREDGEILIQYNQLDGTLSKATVGIEDDQGVDGIAYVFNNPVGISTGTAVRFVRPTATAHSKIYPLYRGGFAYDNKANLWFTIRNNGASGTDTYDLQLSAFNSSWDVKFFNESGRKLSDTNGNGKIDTGALAQGAETRLRVLVESPETSPIGDDIQVDLTVISFKDASKTAQATFTVAIPTPFAQTVLSNGYMTLHMVWRENWISALAAPTQFTGSNLAVQRLPNGDYMYSWEQNISEDAYFHADLRYTILSDTGGVILDMRNLTNNSNVTVRTEDRYLASSVTDTGLIGTVWTRRLKTYFLVDNENKNNYNIYFMVIDQQGYVVVPETNITQNNSWRGDKDLNVPIYLNPRISATTDNRFVIAWERNIRETTDFIGDNGSIDIEYAVYTNNGTQVKAPTTLTNSEPKVVDYLSPALADMANNQALLSFVTTDEVLQTDTLSYAVLDSNGNIVKAITDIPGSNGASLHDSIRLGNATMLLAWPSMISGKVGFCLLDANTGAITLGAQDLFPPNFRDPDSVSVARDKQGRGIITWRDRSQAEYLYYALVDPSGSILTPATTFLSSANNDSIITTNGYGFGLASYEGSWRVTLPFTSR